MQQPRSFRASVDAAVGEFFREGAVLIGVFGPLDPILKGGRMTAIAIVGLFGATVALFLIGLSFTLRAEGSR